MPKISQFIITVPAACAEDAASVDAPPGIEERFEVLGQEADRLDCGADDEEQIVRILCPSVNELEASGEVAEALLTELRLLCDGS